MINMKPTMDLVNEICGHAIDEYITLVDKYPIPDCHCWNPARDKHQLDCSTSRHRNLLRRSAVLIALTRPR